MAAGYRLSMLALQPLGNRRALLDVVELSPKHACVATVVCCSLSLILSVLSPKHALLQLGQE